MYANGLRVCQHSDACSPQGFWVGPGAQTFPSFQTLQEEAFFLVLFTPVCYTNATFNECYDVEEFKKPCCTIYMVDVDVGGSVGNYPNFNDKYLNVGS